MSGSMSLSSIVCQRSPSKSHVHSAEALRKLIPFRSPVIYACKQRNVPREQYAAAKNFRSAARSTEPGNTSCRHVPSQQSVRKVDHVSLVETATDELLCVRDSVVRGK